MVLNSRIKLEPDSKPDSNDIIALKWTKIEFRAKLQTRRMRKMTQIFLERFPIYI